MNQLSDRAYDPKLALCLAMGTSVSAGTGGGPEAVSAPRSAPQAIGGTNVRLIIGETAQIAVTEAGLTYLARIDTGARITSIHALDIEVADGVPDELENKGKTVRFRTINENGEEHLLESKIVDVASVRNAQGTEYRYVVELTLVWRGFQKAVQVNLRDRSAMTYKLLIGRNWLAKDFLVDVDRGKPE